MKLAFDAAGLAPAIVQDRLTGEVRMLGWVNAASRAATAETGRMTFFSRSRGELWEKGATSGNTLAVARMAADCDRDALLALVDPRGPTCHTGKASCFFRAFDDEATDSRSAAGDDAADDGEPAAPYLVELERVIERRKTAPPGSSYTRDLLAGGAARLGAKIREEADELARAIDHESTERVASEAADVLYHLMVALASRGVPMRDAIGVLASRAGVSGHLEKATR